MRKVLECIDFRLDPELKMKTCFYCKKQCTGVLIRVGMWNRCLMRYAGDEVTLVRTLFQFK